MQDRRGSVADIAAFELIVETGDGEAGGQDKVRRVVPIRPYGVPVYVTASGTASSDTTAWVEPPKDMPLRFADDAGHHRPDSASAVCWTSCWARRQLCSFTRGPWLPGWTLPPAI